MNLDQLTQDEHGGPFRSRRGDDPRKKLTERLSSEERKITATFVSVGGLEGGWSELKRGFPKVGSHGPLLSRALTRLAGDLVIHWGSYHHIQERRDAKIYPPKFANNPGLAKNPPGEDRWGVRKPSDGLVSYSTLRFVQYFSTASEILSHTQLARSIVWTHAHQRV